MNIQPSSVTTGQPTPIIDGPAAALKQLSNDLKEYTSRIERTNETMTQALNLLIRWLAPANTAATQAGVLAATAASQTVMSQNPDRKFAAIINADLATDVNLTLGAVAVAATGITLRPGGVFTFGTNTDMKYTGEVSAICAAAGTATITFIEA